MESNALNHNGQTSTAQKATLKESFSDPFNVKSFSASAASDILDGDFVSMANDSLGKMSLNGKRASIDQASSVASGDTTYFSTISAEMSLSSIHANNESMDSQQTIIVTSYVQPVKHQAGENPFGRPDDTLEQNDLLNSNAEIDPFNTNINVLDSLSKDDPFNSRDDFFGTSKLAEDSKSGGQFEVSSICNGSVKISDKANRSGKVDTQIDFGDDSRFDGEFEQLPSNVTYLDPDAFEKQFADESSFEKLDENECAMARRLGAKLENIPEDSRERNSSESEGEFENEFVGPAQLVKHQSEHSRIERTPGDAQMSSRADQTNKGESFVLDDKKAAAQKTFTVDDRKTVAQETSMIDGQKAVVQETFIVRTVDIAGQQAAAQETRTIGDGESKRLDMDKLTIWQLENEEKVKLKDEQEMKAIDQLKASAANELADWYVAYENERKLRMDNNR